MQQKLELLCKGFNGDVGFYVKDLKRNTIVASFNADTVFPTASIVKLPILLGVMQKVHSGELTYHQNLVYTDSLLYPGTDVLGSFKNGETIELSKVIMLMCTLSDNTASLWLQSLAGSGTVINSLLEGYGFANTRVNSRTPGREANRNKYGWGQTSPKEMATFMELMVKGKLINAEYSGRMLKIISRNYWDEEALSQIPAGVFVASKNGAVDASRSEVIYVNGNSSSYIISVFTKNNKDISWDKNNEAWKLTRNISSEVWNFMSRR